MSEFVTVRDVGLRDGLQLTSSMISLEDKLEWYQKLSQAGVPEVELTSFVSRALLPQFADASELLSLAKKANGAKVSTLCPSLNMARRALDAGTPQINFVISASETHQQANVGRSIERSLTELDEIAAELGSRQLRGQVRLSVAISMSFGCSFEGRINAAKVVGLCERIVAAGADELCLADTVGYATPYAVTSLFRAAAAIIPADQLCGHFHDTYGTALANITAALAAGVRRFDATTGGLGGCPFALGASGNVATEDCVYLLEELGFETGISVEALLGLVEWITTLLPNEQLTGRISRLKPPKSWVKAELGPPDMDLKASPCS